MNAPVILIVNVSDKLVNGLNGYVREIDENSVSVYFPCIKETHTITAFTYFSYSYSSGKDIFVCLQIPLLSGFALTIHRSQGMTLPSVALHCEGAFESGQIGVGLSRVHSPSDITIYNFRPGLCPPHSPDLRDVYATNDEGYPMVDLSCCSQLSVSDSVPVAIQPLVVNGDGCDNKSNHEDFDDDDDDDDFTFFVEHYKEFVEEADDTDNDVHTHSYTDLPDDLKPHALRQKLKYESPVTPTQMNINSILECVTDSSLARWTQQQVMELNSTMKRLGSENTKQCNVVIKYFLHEYPNSQSFVDSQKYLFHIACVEQVHQIVCMNAMVRIQNCVFECASKHKQPFPPCPPYRPQTVGGKSKIRYVGGMCVGKIPFPYTQYLTKHCSQKS